MAATPLTGPAPMPDATHRRLTIPNALSFARLAGTPVLFVLAERRPLTAFVAWYVGLGLTDFLDGRLARAWGQVSDFGSMLDSVADVAFFLATAWFAVQLFPEALRPSVPLIVACLVQVAALVLLTRVRLGRVLLPHTHLSRAAGAIVVAAFLVAFVTDATWLFLAGAACYTVALAEQILMCAMSREVRQDTRSILDLVGYARRAREALHRAPDAPSPSTGSAPSGAQESTS